jgi:hypothetical protein
MTGSDNACYANKTKDLADFSDGILCPSKSTDSLCVESAVSRSCAICAKPLTSRQKSVCSHSCRAKRMHVLHPQQGSGNHNFKGWRSKHPVLYTRAFKQLNPEKARAHRLVGNAIRSGRLVRPAVCSQCDCPCRPDAHHDDYAQPMAVRWLCRACHGMRDRWLAAQRAQAAAGSGVYGGSRLRVRGSVASGSSRAESAATRGGRQW